MGKSTTTTQTKDGLLGMIRDGKHMTLRQQLILAAQLSIPAILAQLSTIVMQYIDAAMVGHLGANEAAAVGLVSTSLWLLMGLGGSLTSGFSVQVAHLIGARRNDKARAVLRQAIVFGLSLGFILAIVGGIISPYLPHWLGGNDEINSDASAYFLIFALSIPFFVFNYLCGGMLRCSGNMRIPSILNVLLCVLDVVFNFALIYPTREVSLLGLTFTMPGAGMGVMGAAVGSSAATVIVGLLMGYYLIFRSRELNLMQDTGSYRPTHEVVSKAVGISLPMALQQSVMSSGQIFATMIIAPLGNIAIAANSLAVEAEGLCYMPGYGIGDAATTLVGQSLGAGRRYLSRQFARITVALAMVVMGLMGFLLYIGAPVVMGLLTSAPEVIDLGAQVLRVEAFAEPMFAAAIVCYSVFIGAGDTLIPCMMNAGSMWLVRLTLGWVLVNVFHMGLMGMWLAMCIELCFRGLIFLLRLWKGNWTHKTIIATEQPTA